MSARHSHTIKIKLSKIIFFNISKLLFFWLLYTEILYTSTVFHYVNHSVIGKAYHFIGRILYIITCIFIHVSHDDKKNKNFLFSGNILVG